MAKKKNKDDLVCRIYFSSDCNTKDRVEVTGHKKGPAKKIAIQQRAAVGMSTKIYKSEMVMMGKH